MEKKRSLPVAVLVSLALPGLGQLYCGRWGWALFWWLDALAGFVCFGLLFGVLGTSLGPAYYASLGWMLVAWLGAALQAGWMAWRAGPNYPLRFYNLIRVYVLCWLAGSVLPVYGAVRLSRAWWVASFVVEQDSMRPTLLPGDLVLLDLRRSGLDNLERGAVVAWRDPDAPEAVRLARVVGLEGEQVRLAREGLTVEGKVLDRQAGSPVSYPRRSESGAWEEKQVLEQEEDLGGRRIKVLVEADETARRAGEWRAGPGQVVLLGDNRSDPLALAAAVGAKESLLGRALLVRFSRDLQTLQWRLERRRLVVE